jgi:hypothetical protein
MTGRCIHVLSRSNRRERATREVRSGGKKKRVANSGSGKGLKNTPGSATALFYQNFIRRCNSIIYTTRRVSWFPENFLEDNEKPLNPIYLAIDDNTAGLAIV